MSTLVQEQVKDFVKKSSSVKKGKIARAKSETGQLAKDVASYLCRGTRGIKIPISGELSVVKVDTTCSNCGDRSGEAFIVDGKQFCRTCKPK